MVSKFSPLSRLLAGLGIVAMTALPALAQTPSVTPATGDATKPADKKAGATSGTAHVEKKETTHKVAKNLHKDGKDGAQKPSSTATPTPAAKKAGESVKIESAPSKL